MRETRSTWRVSDALAYEAMRAKLNDRIARMLVPDRDDAANGTYIRADVIDLRQAALDVNGFDRAAVDRFAAHLEKHGNDAAPVSS